MKITYFDLVNAVLMVTALICIHAVGEGGTGRPLSPLVIGLTAFVIAMASLIGGRLRKPAVSRRTAWARPVSDGAGRMIINGVLCLWLAFVLGVGVLFVVISKSAKVAIVALLLAFLTAWLGRTLGKRYARKSLLPCGVTALGALFIYMGFVILAH